MPKSFEELAAKAKSGWSDDAKTLHAAASEAFAEKSSSMFVLNKDQGLEALKLLLKAGALNGTTVAAADLYEAAKAATIAAWKLYLEARKVEADAAMLWDAVISTESYDCDEGIAWRVANRRADEALIAYERASELQLNAEMALKKGTEPKA